MIDVAEGRRLKAAAEKAWETYVNISGGDEHAEYLEVEKTSEAWEKWRDANIDALLDAAERTEAAEPMRRALAAERELAEARAKIDALMLEYCPDEMTPGQVDEWARHQRPIDAERGK